MKGKFKSISYFIIGAFLLIRCGEKTAHDGYIVTGKIIGADVSWVKLIQPQYTDRSNDIITVIDSAQVENGIFKMKGKVKNVDMMQISIDAKYYSMGGFLLENSSISLEIDLSTADKYGQFTPTIRGSKSQEAFDRQHTKNMKIFNDNKYAPLIKLREEMSTAYSSKDEKQIAAINEKADSLQNLQDAQAEEIQMAKVNYVKNNPSSPAAVYILGFEFVESRMTKKRMKEVYPLFTGAAKKTAMYAYYKKTYTEIFESFNVGSKVPDFTLKSLNGEQITLSKIKGKYILIDFWASWCAPCRESFPHLKELYKKYHKNGFEVLGVGTADIGSKWKKAIEKDKTPWLHVFDGDVTIEGNGKTGSFGQVAVKYGVPFLPTTFLIDGEGKIVARQIRGKNIDVILKELFGY